MSFVGARRARALYSTRRLLLTAWPPPGPPISMLLRTLLPNLRNYFRENAPAQADRKADINIEIGGAGAKQLQTRSANLHVRFGK